MYSLDRSSPRQQLQFSSHRHNKLSLQQLVSFSTLTLLVMRHNFLEWLLQAQLLEFWSFIHFSMKWRRWWRIEKKNIWKLRGNKREENVRGKNMWEERRKCERKRNEEGRKKKMEEKRKNERPTNKLGAAFRGGVLLESSKKTRKRGREREWKVSRMRFTLSFWLSSFLSQTLKESLFVWERKNFLSLSLSLFELPHTRSFFSRFQFKSCSLTTDEKKKGKKDWKSKKRNGW